jgi:hypothetical protein
MLRIQFTAEDLARIRILADPHPLWEVLLGSGRDMSERGNELPKLLVGAGVLRGSRAAG